MPILTCTTDNVQDLISQWAEPAVAIPAYHVSSGLTDGQKTPVTAGERFAMILQQQRGQTIISDSLRADRLDLMTNFADHERVPGFQWQSDDSAAEFRFTIVGIYEYVDDVPTGGTWPLCRFRNVAPADTACTVPGCSQHMGGDPETTWHGAFDEGARTWRVEVQSFDTDRTWRVYGYLNEHDRIDETPGLHADDVAAFADAYRRATALADELNAAVPA